jgi:hypothetical protein
VPLEDFIQALSAQLDRVQSGMALKVKAGLPLTFAVKDLSLDLKAHVDVEGPVVRIRSAGPGDADASTIRLAMTTITRPLMQENTPTAAADPSDSSLGEVLGDELSPDDLRRLEWAGVQTVSQLRRLQETAGEGAIGRVANVPALRLRAALERASQPAIHDVLVEPPSIAPRDEPPLDLPPRRGFDRAAVGSFRPPVPPAHLDRDPGPRVSAPPGEPGPASTLPADDVASGPHIRIAGRNFLRDGLPAVRLGEEPLHVVSANPRELVVRAPAEGVVSGMLEVETPAGVRLRHPVVGQARPKGSDA